MSNSIENISNIHKIDIEDSEGMTTLMSACKYGCNNITRELISNKI